MFQPSTVDEGELLKLIENHLLSSSAILQWQPTKDEDIPTSNTNEIVVLTSFFQHGFGLPTCRFSLLHYYKIELVYLNPNSILQIVIFVHLCETYLAILLNFSLFKHYFLKYQPSTAKWQIIDSVGIQARLHRDFHTLPLKTPLKGWYKQWFYCKNHEPSLPPFVGCILG
jgi:hypothetical protein